MTMSFNAINEILKTLPIGYYLGTKADVELTEKNETYCEPCKNKIWISYPAIARLAKALPNESLEENENNMRCLLYHELSHIILTPTCLDEYLKSPINAEPIFKGLLLPIHDIANIMEDARIETNLAEYYHGVDFRSFVFKYNGVDPKAVPAPTTPLEAFYSVVRFYIGKPEYVKEGIRICLKYPDLKTHSEDRVNFGKDTVALYKKIYEEFKIPEKKSPTPEKTEPTDDINPLDGSNSEKTEPTDDINPLDGSNSEKTAPGKSDSGMPTDAAPCDMEIGELINEVCKELGMTSEELLKKAKEYFKKESKKVLTHNLDMSIDSKLETIITNYLNKQTSFGAVQVGYSGRVDPRKIVSANRDYRWFSKSNGDLSGKASKIKLNLFVDVSGSFHRSQDYLNNLIRALTILESKYKMFSFDVVKMGCFAKGHHNFLADKNDRFVKCDCGNCFDDTIFAPYKKVQDSTAKTYNIVVFDGDAFSDIYTRYTDLTRSECKKCLRVFNNKNTMIISDRDNEFAIRKYSPNSSNTFICDNYAQVFVGKIIETLSKAFA